MNAAVELALYFITSILTTFEQSPLLFLVALAVVLIVLNNIYTWVKGGNI